MDFKYVAFFAVFLVLAAGAAYFFMTDSDDGSGDAFFKDPDDLVVGDYIEFTTHLSTESERKDVRITVSEVDPVTYDLKVEIRNGNSVTSDEMTAEEFIGLVNLRGGLYSFTSSMFHETIDTCDGETRCDIYQVSSINGGLATLHVRTSFDVIYKTSYVDGAAERYLDLVDTTLYDRTPE